MPLVPRQARGGNCAPLHQQLLARLAQLRALQHGGRHFLLQPWQVQPQPLRPCDFPRRDVFRLRLVRSFDGLRGGALLLATASALLRLHAAAWPASPDASAAMPEARPWARAAVEAAEARPRQRPRRVGLQLHLACRGCAYASPQRQPCLNGRG